MIRPPPRYHRPDTRFPYTTPFRSPGANDDGSGTTAVMEMARVMSAHRFGATLIFVCVAGEEQGLLGSGHLAARAAEEDWQVARSEERRVGKECVSTCRSRWSPYH